MTRHIYLYDAEGADFSTLGYGPIPALDAVFAETGNGDSVLTVEVAYDVRGLWSMIQPEMIIAAYVPVRMTPELDAGNVITGVERWRVKDTASKVQRILYSTKNGDKKKDKLPKGTEVTVVKKPTDAKRYKVKSGEYGTGWIDQAALEYIVDVTLPSDPAGIETAETPWVISKQLFRIHRYTRNETSVTVEARHITYDLLGAVTKYYEKGAAEAQTALNAILGNTLTEHDFSLQSNITGTRTGIDWRYINPISALLDPEKGFIARWGGYLIRDNYEMTVLADVATNRGIEVSYGKNLQGVEVQADHGDVVVGILPLGRKKDGSYLRLTDDGSGDIIYIDGAESAVGRIYILDCGSDAKVTDDVGEKLARARMREKAQELIDGGAAIPSLSMTVDFLQLGDTDEYAQFRDLERIYLYDWIRIRYPERGIESLMQMVGIEYDPIKQRFTRITLGDGTVSMSTMQLASFQIPNGLNGYKILPNSIGGGQLEDDIINARHIQADSITTRAVQAESITAEKIAAGAIEAKLIEAETVIADLLKANKITAEMIDAGIITTDKIAAGAITADKIAAGAVDAEKIAARSITAELLQAGIITADSGLIAVGAIQTAQIADGSITAAKIVSLDADVITSGTLKTDRLLLVGEGGVVYEINAAASGLSQTELTKEQYKNQLNGTVIVANSITAAQIAAGTITANEIAANAITAAKINVADLFANEATIQAINAMDITSNTYLQLMVAGGVNLLKDSARGASGTGYPLITYDLGETIADGETVTVTIWGASLGSGKTHWSVFDGGGMYLLGQLEDAGGGVFKATFKYKASGNASRIALYPMPSGVTATSTVGKAKLERGSRSTSWTASPLDPADAVRAGSTVTINEQKVEISTPEFRVDTPGAFFTIPGSEDGSPIVEIDQDGLTAERISAKDGIWAPNLRELETADHIYTIEDGGSLQTVFDGINGKNLDGDIVVQLLGSASGGTLSGVSGTGRVIISPINLINIENLASVTNENATPTFGADSAGGEYIYVRAGSAGTYRRVAMDIGHIGALDLRGKRLAFRCSMNSGSATNAAMPEVRVYCGKDHTTSRHIATFARGTPEGTTATNYVFVTGSFVVPEDAEDTDLLWMRFHASAETSVNSGATAFFRYPVLLVGDEANSNTPRNRKSSVGMIRIKDCNVRTYLHHLSFAGDGNKCLSTYDSHVSVNRCTFSGAKGLVLWGGCGAMYNCYGTCTNAADARGGGAIEIFGTAPAGTKTGLVDTSNMATTTPPAGDDVVAQPATIEIKAKATGTYSGSAWWTSDAAMRQGWTETNHTLRGAVIFDLASLSGKTVSKAVLRIKRVEGYGKGGDVDVKIYRTNITSLSGAPTKYDDTFVGGKMAPGETKSFDVTEILRRDNLTKAFVLQADDSSVMSGKTYSTNYARFAGTGSNKNMPVLTVTYE